MVSWWFGLIVTDRENVAWPGCVLGIYSRDLYYYDIICIIAFMRPMIKIIAIFHHAGHITLFLFPLITTTSTPAPWAHH